MTKKILITGAAGYLGSVLVERFLAEGCQVKGVDNSPEAPGILSQALKNPRFHWIEGDVCDETLMKRAIQNSDVIIPTAAIVGAPKCDKNPEQAWAVNFQAIELLNSLRSKDQWVLFPMTNNGYLPGREITEESPWNDRGSLYTRSKYEAEQLLLKSGNAISFRLASLFGVSASMRWDLLIHFLLRAAFAEKEIDLFDAEYKRSFVHIQDVADAFAFAADHSTSMKNQVFNLGLKSGNISKRDLVEQIRKVLPDLCVKDNHVETDPDARDFFVSTEKLKNAGFEASRSTQQGIREVLEFLKTHDLTLRGAA